MEVHCKSTSAAISPHVIGTGVLVLPFRGEKRDLGTT